MQRSRLLRHLALLAAIAMFATACGGDDASAPDDDPAAEEEMDPAEDPAADPDMEPTDDPMDDMDEPTDDMATDEPTDDMATDEPTDDMAMDEPTDEMTGEATDEATDAVAADEGEQIGEGEGLILGYILPESGPLASLGPPQIEAVRLAIDDINEAGGVDGTEVTLITGDEAGDEAIAQETANRLVSQGVHGVVGAAASGMSQAFIQNLFDNEIPQCSAANTSPAFSTQDNADFYFRTVPPDEAVAPIIADTVIGDGAASVAIVARADDYGNALAGLVDDAVTAQGGDVVYNDTYDPNATTFDAEVGSIDGAGADAVVVIGFDEAGQLIGGLLEAGFAGDRIYGGDGLFGPGLIDLVGADAATVEGIQVIGAAGGEEFNARLSENVGGNLIYGGQAYDCAIILALAAQDVGYEDPEAMVQAAIDATSGGEPCTDYASCLELLEAGEDIDYEGAAGPLELDEVGDPTVGRYAVGQFQDGELVIVGDQDADLADL